MKAIDSSFEIITPISEGGVDELKKIELCARNCYKSEGRISEDLSSARALITRLIDSGHEAMLEHGSFSVRFVCDRGCSHELVRHRMASFAQESTRYCNYGLDKFGRELQFVLPRAEMDGNTMILWWEACKHAEQTYLAMLDIGVKPEIARSVLPNSLKTEVIMTANYREWRHIFDLRCSQRAHPDIRWLMLGLLEEVQGRIPVIFDDLYGKYIGVKGSFNEDDACEAKK